MVLHQTTRAQGAEKEWRLKTTSSIGSISFQTVHLSWVNCPKNVAKISGTRAQDDTMRFDGMTLACKGHVSKVLVLAQSAEGFCIFLLVVVPAKAEVFILHRLRPHGVVSVLFGDEFEFICFFKRSSLYLCQNEALFSLCESAP